MPSYATQATRMTGLHAGGTRSSVTDLDLYRSDWQAIHDKRRELARDLYLSDLRMKMEVARWVR